VLFLAGPVAVLDAILGTVIWLRQGQGGRRGSWVNVRGRKTSHRLRMHVRKAGEGVPTGLNLLGSERQSGGLGTQ
jgi:hypothetical protein